MISSSAAFTELDVCEIICSVNPTYRVSDRQLRQFVAAANEVLADGLTRGEVVALMREATLIASAWSYQTPEALQ